MTKIKLKHIRAKDLRGNTLARGGFTIAAEIDDQENVIALGIAKCRKTDNFNKSIGLIKAKARLSSLVDRKYPNVKYGELLDKLESFALHRGEKMCGDLPISCLMLGK